MRHGPETIPDEIRGQANIAARAGQLDDLNKLASRVEIAMQFAAQLQEERDQLRALLQRVADEIQSGYNGPDRAVELLEAAGFGT